MEKIYIIFNMNAPVSIRILMGDKIGIWLWNDVKKIKEKEKTVAGAGGKKAESDKIQHKRIWK